ncbi:MAG: DUF3995 domain-containing protein [Leptospirales bacterium]
MQAIEISGALLTLIFAAIGAIHMYWALGGRWGGHAALPQMPASAPADQDESADATGSGLPGKPVFLPGVAATIAVALIFLAGAAGCVALLASPEFRAWRWSFLSPALGAYVGGAIFLLRVIGDFKYVGFSKTIRGTQFAYRDDRFFSPLCLVIAVLLLIFARNL